LNFQFDVTVLAQTGFDYPSQPGSRSLECSFIVVDQVSDAFSVIRFKFLGVRQRTDAFALPA
jgi:hypothetical protein